MGTQRQSSGRRCHGAAVTVAGLLTAGSVLVGVPSAAGASGTAAAADRPVASGSLAFSGSPSEGSSLSVGGVSWSPQPCSSSHGCSVALTVSYRWQACNDGSGASCTAVSPAVVEALEPSYRPGPIEVGKWIEVTETATDVRTKGTTEKASVTGITGRPVAPWPAGRAPRVRLANGTPDHTTASDQERFDLSPAFGNPTDGPVTVTCSLDGSPPSPGCAQHSTFETPLLAPGAHTFSVTASSRAGSTTTSFRWQVVALPAPLGCAACFHPPSVAADGQPMTWDWQLSNQNSGLVLRDVDMLDIDGFNNSAATVATIHARSGPTLSSEKAICYLDLGAWEQYRPDAASFGASVVGKPLSGWPGERWVDVRQLRALEPIIDARLQMCADKHFDGVEVDDIDGYTQPQQTGFPLTAGDAQNWLASVANEAHRLGMFVLWKNDPYLAGWAVGYFDGSLSEECYRFQECTPEQNAGSNGCNLTTDRCGVGIFAEAGKWVGEVEYGGVCPPSQGCSGARSYARYCATVWDEPPAGFGFAAFKADLSLDGDNWFPCWDSTG